ncbi:MAG: hypothetical protein ACI96M_000424 [Candidatus Azotimanducaceae bacterium]|jgi:hypothetical protein
MSTERITPEDERFPFEDPRVIQASVYVEVTLGQDMFDHGQLQNAELWDVRRASFCGADLRGATLLNISGADFTESKINGDEFAQAFCARQFPPVGLPETVLRGIRLAKGGPKVLPSTDTSRCRKAFPLTSNSHLRMHAFWDKFLNPKARLHEEEPHTEETV